MDTGEWSAWAAEKKNPRNLKLAGRAQALCRAEPALCSCRRSMLCCATGLPLLISLHYPVCPLLSICVHSALRLAALGSGQKLFSL